MSVRTALNVTYALMVQDMDKDQRQKFDDEIHGWGEMNERANRDMHARVNGGGEG